MTKIRKCLLALEVFEFTGEEIGKLREQYKHDRYLDSILPKWTFNSNTNDGRIIESPGFLQFIEDGTDKIILFNASTVDRLLEEEISNSGLDNMLEETDLRPYLENFKKHSYDDFCRCLPSAEYLIIGLEYTNGGYFNEYEVDLHVSVEGALVGNNLTLIEKI